MSVAHRQAQTNKKKTHALCPFRWCSVRSCQGRQGVCVACVAHLIPRPFSQFTLDFGVRDNDGFVEDWTFIEDVSACGSECAVKQPQYVNTLRHLRSSSRHVADLHRNVGVIGTDISLFTSGKAAPKQTNQKTKTPLSHTGSTTHVIKDPKPDSFGASSSS